MLPAYLVAFGAYAFGACSGLALIYAINLLDPPETEQPHHEASPQQLKLAS